MILGSCSSQLFLRKTVIEQVVKVYGEFIRKFSISRALLSASENEVRGFIKSLRLEHQHSGHLNGASEAN